MTYAGRNKGRGMRQQLANGATLSAMLMLITIAAPRIVQAQNIDIQVLYQFTGGADGNQVYGPLAGDKAGNLYGTTSQGGAYGKGTVWNLDPSGKETVLYSFNGTWLGYTGLVRDAENNLYGMTLSGGTY